MHEMKRYEFEGRAYDARVVNGEEWFTAAQVADMLGHETPRSVLKLYRNHASEFLPHETCEMLLADLGPSEALNSERPARRGNPRIKVRLFSMDGVEHLAMLAKKAGIKLRRWCIDLRGRFRRGESAEITAEQFAALKAERDSWRTRALDSETHIGALEMRFARLEGRFESLCAAEDTRLSRDAANVAESRNRPEVYAIGRDRKRREQIERRGYKEQLLFEGMEGPDAFEALRARCFAIVTAECKRATADGKALRYMRHKFARLAKGAPHRQAIAAIDSLVTDGSIDIQGGRVSVATQMTTARKAGTVVA